MNQKLTNQFPVEFLHLFKMDIQNSQNLKNTKSEINSNMSKNQEKLLQKLATMSNARTCTINVNELQKLLKESHETILNVQNEKQKLEQELAKALETIAKLKTKIEVFKGKEDVEEIDPEKKLMTIKPIENKWANKDETNSFELPIINQVLPIEMFKKILEKLDIKSLCIIKQTCKHWKEIVDEFELIQKASSKYL